MFQYNCKYHPHQNAVAKCEKCGAMLCLQCKSVYRMRHNSTHHHHSYSNRIELCPECYEERVKRSNNPLTCILPVIFIIIFMTISSSMFSGIGSFGFGGIQAVFFIVPILMLVIIGYQYFVKGPQRIAEAKRRKEASLNSMNYSNTSSVHDEHKYTSSKRNIPHCNQCGALIENNSSFCSNCGNSTVDEFS